MKVFKLLRYVLVSAFLIGGASVVNAQDEDLPVVVYGEDMASAGYIEGYGTMTGAGKIFMSVSFTAGEYVAASYYYVKTNKGRKNKAYIYLSGTYQEDGYLYLEESENGPKNGYFSGYLSNSGVYKGTFYRNDGKKFPFTVKMR